MNKNKKIIIAIVILILFAIAFLHFVQFQSPQGIAYSASKKSFEFVKSVPFSKKSFKLKSGEVSFTASQSKKEVLNLLVRRDARGHFFITLVAPQTDFSIYLIGDNIIVKQPKALVNGEMSGLWYYKFKKGTLGKLKEDIIKLKSASVKNKNTTKKINTQFLKDFENFSKKNTEWTKAKANGATLVTAKIPLLKLIDFASGELDKSQKMVSLQDSNNEQTAIVKDIINTILDDLLSGTGINDTQKKALKKQIFSSIDKLHNENSLNESSLANIKKNIEKMKEQLAPSDNVTITLKVNDGKISEIVILPQIKKVQDKIQKISVEFKYNNNLLKLVTLNLPSTENQNGNTVNNTVKANILYDNNMWNGMEISSYTDKVNSFKATLIWNVNKQVADIKPPILTGALDIRILLGSLLQMSGQ